MFSFSFEKIEIHGFGYCRKKRVRFPKGKKVKPGDEATVKRSVIDDEFEPSPNPRSAATTRAKRRDQITMELFNEDSSTAEVAYEVGF